MKKTYKEEFAEIQMYGFRINIMKILMNTDLFRSTLLIFINISKIFLFIWFYDLSLINEKCKMILPLLP